MTLPAELQAQFAEVERRLWRKETMVAACGAAAALFVSFGLLFISDRFWETPPILRALSTLLGVGVLVWFGHRWLRLWVWRKRDLNAFARVVQKHHRRLGDRLLGIVELAEEKELPANMSPELRDAAIRQVADEASKVDFKAAISQRQATRYLAVAAILFALAITPFVLVPQAGWTTLKRWIAPGSDTDRFTFVTIGDLPDKLIVPHGEEFAVSVSLDYESFWQPSKANARVEQQAPIEAPVQNGAARFTVPGQTRAGSLLVRAGDVKKSMQILPTHRPLLKDVVARVQLPEYLQYPPQTQSVQNASLTALAGSRASFRGTGSRPLTKVVMQTQTAPARALSLRDGFFQTAPLPLDDTPNLTFICEDELGLTNKTPYSLVVRQIQDFAPNVDLPELQSETAILETDIVSLKAVSRDDYGVKDVGIRWQIVSATDETNQLLKTAFHFDSSLPDETELKETFLFSPSVVGAPPESVIEMRAYSKDYFPGRESSQSMAYRFYIIGLVEHAEWTRQTFEDLFARLEELTRTEESIAETAREMKNLPESEMAAEETTEDIGEQGDKQSESNRELEQIVREAARALKEALRNPTFDEKTIEQWAQTLSEMKEISEQEMSDAKQSLQKAQQSSEDRKDKLAKALEDIEKALEKLAKMQEKMNEGLDNLEALTLAQRLREASKSEQQIERELLSMAPETIGLKFDRMSARYQKATVKAAATQNEVRDEAEKLQAEISRFFERTQRPNYGEVAEEMEASETYEKLKFVSLLIGANTTMQSIERLTHWSEQFEAWAKHIDPEPQESGESGEGEYSQDDLMQLLVAMIRMRAEQDNLRGRTGMLEEQKARDPNYAKRVGELADDQGELKGKMDDIVRKNPVEVLDGILRETGGSMAATLQQLAKPDTGADTVQAEMRTIRLMTDVINLINEQSQQQQQQQQQSAQPGQEREFIMEMAEQQPGEAPGQQPGAMPGMGPRAGDGSLPNGKPTGNGLGKGAANRRVGHASGATRPVPSEFRAAMESYFKGVESIEQLSDD